jgi:hypothetical protein
MNFPPVDRLPKIHNQPGRLWRLMMSEIRQRKLNRRHEIPRATDFSFRLTIYLSLGDNRMQQIF